MAVAKMSKINIVGSLKERDLIIDIVQDIGLLQIEEHKDETLQNSNIQEELNSVEYKLAGVKFSLGFLADYDVRKKSIVEKFNLKKIEISREDLKEKINNFNFKFFKEVQETQRRINQAENIIIKAKEDIKTLSPWKKLSFSPSRYNLPQNVDFKLLTLPSLEDLKREIKEKLPLSEIKVVERGKKEVRVSLIYHTDSSEVLKNILDNLNIKVEEIPNLDIAVSDQIIKLEKKIKDQEEILKEEAEKAEKLTEKIEELKIVFDYLTWQKNRLLALQKTANGWHYFSIIAWIEEKKIKTLKKKLSAVSKYFYVEEVEPEEGEKSPVVYENNFLTRPFEFITGIYGAPTNDSPDPTPFLAPFFIVFFGLCLTDAGYGAILALLSFLAIKFIKPGREAKKMFSVLMYGGLATFFAGALVGGWFGIDISNMGSSWLQSLLTSIIVINPVEDPITMLLFSLALGLIQILTGITISMWWKIKNGNIASALLDDFVWLYLLIIILLWSANSFELIEFTFATYLLFIGIFAVILTQGRKAKNPFLKFFTGVISLYGLVGYLSDVLSYSRLLALGLATSIIAMVVNLIAALTIDMIPYLGYVIALIVLIGGHVFNIAINALGSFIHASRLQFVEFFPKFMESGGVNLSPLRKESKYIKII